MGTQRWKTNTTCRKDAREDYKEITNAVRSVLNLRGPISDAAAILIQKNHININDLIHDTFIFARSRSLSMSYYLPAYLSIKKTVDDYVKFHAYHGVDPTIRRAWMPDDTERTYQFAELADLLSDIGDDVIWLVLSKLVYFRMIVDGILSKSIYDINIDDARKIIVASDYLLEQNGIL